MIFLSVFTAKMQMHLPEQDWNARYSRVANSDRNLSHFWPLVITAARRRLRLTGKVCDFLLVFYSD